MISFEITPCYAPFFGLNIIRDDTMLCTILLTSKLLNLVNEFRPGQLTLCYAVFFWLGNYLIL